MASSLLPAVAGVVPEVTVAAVEVPLAVMAGLVPPSAVIGRSTPALQFPQRP